MWYNSLMIWLLRSPLHGLMSENTMLMTYKGRKSGKTYTTPMNYLELHDEEGDYLLTTSLRSRTWWRNLRGGAAVVLHLRGKEVQATTRSIEAEPQVKEMLQAYFTALPEHARYFNVNLDASGKPDPVDLQREAKTRLVVRTTSGRNLHSDVTDKGA